jgi:trimeric autotransporter adhesin
MSFSRYLLTACLVSCSILNAQQSTSSQSSAVVPRLVNFSGKAADVQGKAISGIAGVTFAIYKDQYEGAPLWLETQNVQADAKGNYTVQLGATKPDGLPLDLFSSGEARWLGMTVNGGQEQPRVLLLSVPYALKAADAETIGGLPPSAFVLANRAKVTATGTKTAPAALHTNTPPPTNPAVTGKGVVNYIPMWDKTSDIVDSLIFQKSSQIGINTTAPAATLDVNGKGDVRDTLTLFPKGTDPTLAINATTFKVDQTGKVSFVSGQTFPGAGTVTSVGLSAPTTDFKVTASPVTKSGTLALNWNVAPTNNNTANAIVKRDNTGSFAAQNISVTDLFASGNIFMTSPLSNAVNVTSTCASCTGIRGEANSLTGTGYGVFGDSDSTQTGAAGVYGFTSQSTGGTFGVLGESDSGVGLGVAGRRGGSFGIVAQGIIGGVPVGVLGDSNGYGVAATSDNSNALIAGNNGGADTLLVFANGGGAPIFAAGTGGSLLLDALGNLSVSGAIFAGTKDFKIDHPLDPANKYLYHASIESSEMKNIYDGVAVLDASGSATVALPDWFEAVNGDFRYQLTAMGAPGPNLHIAQEIVDNRFTIGGGQAGMKVSWQVTGVRHDAYAKAHPLQVNVEKGPDERGFFIHPELYGAPAEKSLASAHRVQVMQRAKQTQAEPAKATKP